MGELVGHEGFVGKKTPTRELEFHRSSIQDLEIQLHDLPQVDRSRGEMKWSSTMKRFDEYLFDGKVAEIYG